MNYILIVVFFLIAYIFILNSKFLSIYIFNINFNNWTEPIRIQNYRIVIGYVVPILMNQKWITRLQHFQLTMNYISNRIINNNRFINALVNIIQVHHSQHYRLHHHHHHHLPIQHCTPIKCSAISMILQHHQLEIIINGKSHKRQPIRLRTLK